jgi:hypothetical protein
MKPGGRTQGTCSRNTSSKDEKDREPNPKVSVLSAGKRLIVPTCEAVRQQPQCPGWDRTRRHARLDAKILGSIPIGGDSGASDRPIREDGGRRGLSGVSVRILAGQDIRQAGSALVVSTRS